MKNDDQKPADGTASGKPKASRDWSKQADETLKKAAKETSPRFRITKGQRRALRSP